MKCTYINPEGKQCAAFAVRDDPTRLCVFHSPTPETKSRMDEGRLCGGKNSHLKPKFKAPTNLAEAQRLLGIVIAAVANGDMPHSQITQVTRLINLFLKTAELAQINACLDNLERTTHGPDHAKTTR